MMEQEVVLSPGSSAPALPRFSGVQRFLKLEFLSALGLLPFIWQSLFFFIPMLLLFSMSFIDNSSGTLRFTISHFTQLFSTTYLSIILNSVGLSLLTTLITLCIAFPFSFISIFHFSKYKNIISLFLLIPFWTNFILHIYAWFFVLEKNGFLNQVLMHFGFITEPLAFLNNFFSIMVMMIYYYLPFMILPIYSTLERFDSSIFEASMDLGANRFQTLLKVVIPLCIGGIRTGIFLVFIPSFAEFLIPELMGGDKYFFMGNVISLYVFEEKTLGTAVAFTTLSLAVVLMIVYFIQKGLVLFTRRLTRGVRT